MSVGRQTLVTQFHSTQSHHALVVSLVYHDTVFEYVT